MDEQIDFARMDRHGFCARARQVLDPLIPAFDNADHALASVSGPAPSARELASPSGQTPSASGLMSTATLADPSRSPMRGDGDLNPHIKHDLANREKVRAAAVLVPVIARAELTILLTRRSEALASHAGQVSFPGGKIEPTDQSAIDAALRETEEEVGIARGFIRPLGLLDGYATSSGFDITPVVALIEPDFSLRIDANEVAEVFEVPLRILMNDSKYETHSWDWKGKTYRFYAISYDDHYIWGATAGMLRNLSERLRIR